MRWLVAVSVLAPIHRPVLDHLLRLVQSVAVELARLVLGAGCLSAGVIQQVLERIVPEAQQVPHERLRLPAQIAHECPKLGREPDLVLIVQLGNLNPVFVAADGHLGHSSCLMVLTTCSAVSGYIPDGRGMPRMRQILRTVPTLDLAVSRHWGFGKVCWINPNIVFGTVMVQETAMCAEVSSSCRRFIGASSSA